LDRVTNIVRNKLEFDFNLMKSNGKRLGGFALYRKNSASPLWMDLDVFTTTGFSSAVAARLEKMQDSCL